ncbi:MAG: PAS domain S-box protein [Acidobacteriota bacterium]|jgi:PAS domain S-box-containing protein
MIEPPRAKISFMVLCLLLSGLIFAVDLMLPVGIAAGVLHAAVVLLSVAVGTTGFTIGLALFVTLLTIAGVALSPPETVGLWVVISNRLLSLFTIWVVGVLGLLLTRERSRRRGAAEELHQSLARTRSILETAVDGFISIDDRGIVEAVNPAAEEMFGYSEEDLVGRNVKILMPEPWHSEHDDYIDHYLETGERKIIGIGREVMGLRKDGSTFPLELAVSEVEVGGQRAFIGTVRDVSERKRLEEQFLQSQKMEAVGRLAGGVAHDFNTLLSSILGYSEMLADSLPEGAEGDKPRRAAAQIRRSAERGAELTRQLLTFSRQERRREELVDLNRVVHGLSDMLDRLVGEQVELVHDLEPRLARVSADPAQLEQVLVNLVVNAVDAMPGGGRITLSSRNLQPPGAGPDGAGGEGAVQIEVSDTGVGMDESTRRRIFEPFFTTKERGKGTGLGLSTVYGIVTQNGGGISVETAEGEGTTFRVRLPRAAPPFTEEELAAAEASTEGAEAGPVEPGTAEESILLVEDDAMFRGLLEEVLEDQGYTVLAAGEPAEALKLLDRRGKAVDLVVTDLVMPGMTGDELVRRLQARCPEIRAILMSGYSDEHLEARVRTDGRLPMMRKPFSTKEFARRVREVLDAAHSTV